MLQLRRIRGTSSSLTACCYLGAFVCLLLAPVPASAQGYPTARELFFIFVVLPLSLIVLVVAILWLLISCLFRGCRYQTDRKERQSLESRTIEPTEEQRRIMERFGVAYEDRKFHFEGKSYDRLSDIPLK
jgi:hypothetical protein